MHFFSHVCGTASKDIIVFCAVVLGSLLPAIVAAEIRGRVTASNGAPIEHARVDYADIDQTRFTGPRGSFQFEAGPPAVLVISHPRFHSKVIEVVDDSSELIEIVLTPKQEVFEEIAVSANRGEENFSPISIASSAIDLDDGEAAAATLTEAIAATPGTAENGQGGVFQTYSIRGVSRQRVLTLVSGMRIVSERRAGVSASFIDPSLVGGIDVLRGPSSTFYGSGALGGVVQLFPRNYEGIVLESGYSTQGDSTHQTLGWGHQDLSLSVAHRRAGRGEASDGSTLHSGFSQTSARVRHLWFTETLEFEVQAIGSHGSEIEKANIDFPNRVTTYPEENHLLLSLRVQADDKWSLELYSHPNDLETRVKDGDESESLLRNRALDLGFNLQMASKVGPSGSMRFGLEYFGRRDVSAVEMTLGHSSGGPIELSRQRTLDDAQEDELGLYGAVEWNWGNAAFTSGGRATWQRQQNAGETASDDSAFSGFSGVVVPLGAGFEWSSNLGSGLRFPSLSERFFTGTTARGFVTGNLELAPERSLNLDTGIRWYGERLYLAGYLFRNQIDEYVERIETAPGLLTFVNLTSGTIQGGELEGFFEVNDLFTLRFDGHRLNGSDTTGRNLADIPADRVALGGRLKVGRWTWNSRWESRSSKPDVGSGEKVIPSVNMVSSTLGFRTKKGLFLEVSGHNLLDELYFNSADEKVSLAPGRSVGLAIRWK